MANVFCGFPILAVSVLLGVMIEKGYCDASYSENEIAVAVSLAAKAQKLVR